MADETGLKEAYRELDDALRRVIELSGSDDNILIEWIVCCASQRIAEDGTSLTAIDFLVDPDNNAPHYRLMGLVEFVHMLLKQQAMEGDLE